MKERWKWLLAAICLLLVSAIFYLSGILLKKIRWEEEKKIQLWAGAIQKKSELLREAGKLFEEISQEEKIKASIYARATEELTRISSPSGMEFLLYVLQNNRTVPVILTNQKGNILAYRNLDSTLSADSSWLYAQLREMKKKYEPIRLNIYKSIHQFLYYNDSRIFRHSRIIMDSLVQSYLNDVARNSIQVEVLWITNDSIPVAYHSPDTKLRLTSQNINIILQRLKKENPPIYVVLPDGKPSYIYYASSSILTYIRYFPYLFTSGFLLILVLTVFFYSSSYRLEQDRLWVGMSKETAHQLGTPISSLMGWVELLGEKNTDPRILASMKDDLQRLKTITLRFSKIGSRPELKNENLHPLILNLSEYIKKRISKNITLDVRLPQQQIILPMSGELMEWVLENLIKNAVDAMEGSGIIKISAEVVDRKVMVRVHDEGKGIPRKIRKKIFKPGFSTKSRGWGLGLSLSKRIVEEYHGGRLYLEKSDPQSGTVFCMELNLQKNH